MITNVRTEDQLRDIADIGNSLEINNIDAKFQYSVVEVADVETGESQLVHLGLHLGEPDSKRLILRTMPFTEEIDRPFERGRNAALANASGDHVLTIGNLGTGRSSNLNSKQNAGLAGRYNQSFKSPRTASRNSTFDPIGKTLATALSKEVQNASGLLRGLLQTPEFEVVADFYSLGNNTGAALLGHLPEKLQPSLVIWRESLDQLETINVRDIALPFFSSGGDRMADYAKQNGAITIGRPDRVVAGGIRLLRNTRTNIAYGRGVAGGSVWSDLSTHSISESLNRPETIHIVVNGSESISQSEINDRFAMYLGKLSIHAERLVVGGATHPFGNDYRLNAGSVLEAMRMADNA